MSSAAPRRGDRLACGAGPLRGHCHHLPLSPMDWKPAFDWDDAGDAVAAPCHQAPDAFGDGPERLADRQRLPEGAERGLLFIRGCYPCLNWNLRVTADDQALIDRAVRTSGLTRTDFVLQAARTAARELLVQQSWQAVSAETFNQFLRQLDAPWALTAETPASTTGSSSVLWPTSKAVRLWLWPLARWLWPLPPGVFDATCLIPFPWWCLHGWRSAAVPRDAASWFMLPPRKLAVSTSTWVLIPHPSTPTPC